MSHLSICCAHFCVVRTSRKFRSSAHTHTHTRIDWGQKVCNSILHFAALFALIKLFVCWAASGMGAASGMLGWASGPSHLGVYENILNTNCCLVMQLWAKANSANFACFFFCCSYIFAIWFFVFLWFRLFILYLCTPTARPPSAHGPHLPFY